MATALARGGALGIIHRNLPINVQAKMVKNIKRLSGDPASAAVDKSGHLLVGASIGVSQDLDERVKALAEAGIDLLVIDSAHGYTSFMVEGVKRVKKNYPHIPLMAGNVATFDGAKALIDAGADILRVGMGPGSICTTRIVTGMGVPQLSAVSAAARAASGTKVKVIADGGIRQIGDIAKAFAFGAHAVMLGSLLARFKEAPGNIVKLKGQTFKSYRGMGSVAAMERGGGERYGQAKDVKSKLVIAEGVEGLVPLLGSVTDYLYQIMGSLRSSFYYIGARNLASFFQVSRCIKISNAGLLESHPHDIAVINPGANYSKS
jgi:IMP dehydrogenase